MKMRSSAPSVESDDGRTAEALPQATRVAAASRVQAARYTRLRRFDIVISGARSEPKHSTQPYDGKQKQPACNTPWQARGARLAGRSASARRGSRDALDGGDRALSGGDMHRVLLAGSRGVRCEECHGRVAGFGAVAQRCLAGGCRTARPDGLSRMVPGCPDERGALPDTRAA